MANRQGRPETLVAPNDVAVTYSRYSTDKQSELSVERQEEICEKYAAETGRTLLHRYADRARSGMSSVREGLEAMLAAARRREFGVLLVENVDRLARDLSILSSVFKELQSLGIEIHQPGRGKLGITDIAFQGLMGDEGRRLFIERTQYARLRMARDGRFPNAVSFGYVRVPGCPGERAIDDEQAAHVRDIFQMRLEGMSVMRITRSLNQRRIGDRDWHYPGVTHLLRNPIYNGFLVYNQRVVTKDPVTGRRKVSMRPSSEWIVTPLEHLRIVDRDVWEGVQVIGQRSGDAKEPRPAGRKYLLSSKVRCSECGRAMVSTGQKAWRRFVCTGALHMGTCGNVKGVRIDELERLVVDLVSEGVLDQRCTEAYVAAYNEVREGADRDLALERERLEREIAALNRKLDDTFDDALTRGLTSNYLYRKRQILGEDVARMEEALRVMPLRPRPLGIDRGRMTMLREALGEMRARAPFMPEDDAGRRAALAFGELIERVVVRRTGYRRFDVEVYLTVTPLLHGDNRALREGPGKMCLRATLHSSRRYEESDRAQADLAFLADGRHALKDEEWRAVSGLVPRILFTRMFKPLEPRTTIEAYLFVLMTGATWMALPGRFGPTRRVYETVRKLIAHGVWRDVATALNRLDPERYKAEFALATIGKPLTVIPLKEKQRRSTFGENPVPDTMRLAA